jgi:hypothetical protein
MSGPYFLKGKYYPRDDRRCSCSYVKSPCSKCLEGYIRRKEREDMRDVEPFSIWPWALLVLSILAFTLAVIYRHGGFNG